MYYTVMDESDKVQQAIDLLTSIHSNSSSSRGESSARRGSRGRVCGSRSQDLQTGKVVSRHVGCIHACALLIDYDCCNEGERAGACSRARDVIRSVRERLGSQRNSDSEVATEQRSNFASYSHARKPSSGSSKGKTWSIKVVCLSDKNASRVPCSLAEREVLVQAGLGEQKVVVPDIECSSLEFRRVLVTAFPKLGACGGFDLLRCITNSRELEVISPEVSQSAKLLKSVVGNGKIFIRPIQQNLNLKMDGNLANAIEV